MKWLAKQRMRIRITGGERDHSIQIESPSNLLHVLQKQSIKISAPCGGKGTCGKCRVEAEGIGSLLSCQTVLSDSFMQEHGLSSDQELVIRLPVQKKARISTEGLLPDFECSPLLIRGYYEPLPASIKDQRPDDQRFEESTGLVLPFDLLGPLSDRMRQGSGPIPFLFRQDNKQVVKFLREDAGKLLGMAADIGTTTLAAYLYHLESGQRLAAASMLNPQRSYGADVISRIEQVDRDLNKLPRMQATIVQAVSELAAELLQMAGCPDEEIHTVVFSGNTTMMHLLAGLNPTAIARSPFIPVSLAGQILTPDRLGLDIPGSPLCILLPSISAYVGADITAGILACELFPAASIRTTRTDTGRVQKNRLLLDIGTNGEMVLASPDGLTACSTAAGPAFEAANIQCGMGGTEGAIDHISIESDCLTCSVIGGSGHIAVGICGSGLVSAVAALLRHGVIDETGRFTDDPNELSADLAERLVEKDGEVRFYLDQAEGEIYLSQKDIRELQNAKAAMAAGIQRLLSQAGLQPEDLDEVLIAGGFGNYLRAEDAFAIGLLPAGLENKTRAVGNTSGMGAIACLINDPIRQDAALAAKAVRYYELSSDPQFTDLYIDAMFFPEPVT